jgi:hypothetical protein
MQRVVGDLTQQWGSYAHINLIKGHCKHNLVHIDMGECSKTVKDGGRQLSYSTSSYCKYYQYVYVYTHTLHVCVCTYVCMYICIYIYI